MNHLPPIILASGSPRRSEILKRLGFSFVVQTKGVDELEGGMSPEELCVANALLKARAVAADYPDSLVIGSDTVVALGEQLFAKPRDISEAESFLSTLSGNTHQVMSGVALLYQGKETTFADYTKVRFRELSTEIIREYLSLIQPLDKAGGYAIQDHGDMIVEGTEGSMDNVVGFPSEKFLLEIKRLFPE